MTAARWHDAVTAGAHPAVSTARTGRSHVVVKRTSHAEADTHRLVSRLVPAAVPAVLDCRPVPGAAGEVVLVTADCGRSAAVAAHGEPGRTRELLRQGLVALAAVHDGCAADAVSSTLPPPELPVPGGWSAADALTDASQVLGRSWVADRETALVRTERLLPALLSLLEGSADRTLVHGDVHAGNLVVDASGAVRIVDWGSAGLQAAAWDLAWFDDDLVGSYVEARAPRPERAARRFADERRAAQTLRSYAAVADLLADLGTAASPLAPELQVTALRACVDWCLAASADADPGPSDGDAQARDEV